VADLFNERSSAGDAVTAFVEERLAREPAARLRILEVGAGTGGTTAGLLERLRPFRGAIDEYCYADISKAFLMHAQERYVPSHPFVTTRISHAGAVSRRRSRSRSTASTSRLRRTAFTRQRTIRRTLCAT